MQIACDVGSKETTYILETKNEKLVKLYNSGMLPMQKHAKVAQILLAFLEIFFVC